ncbi:hypothetical protein [Sediminicola luteus]|uniref:Uncharacterized protein n=1 Tax=Sediminicola luteus TaxID=319238 RepID=A0ABV2TYQ3_9FLAO
MKNKIETLKGFLNKKTLLVVFLSITGLSCTTDFEDEGLFDNSKPVLYALSTIYSIEITNSFFYKFRKRIDNSVEQDVGLESHKAQSSSDGQIQDTTDLINLNFLDTEHFLSKKLKKKDPLASLNRYFKSLREGVS